MRLGFRNLAGLMVLVGTLALLLAGCGGSTTAAGPKPLPDAQQIFHPLDSGAAAGDYVTMDPAQVQFGADYDKAQLFFPPLVTLSDDLKVIPYAAKSYEPDTTGKIWTFHLNSGMKWSDGVPIDANTFAYSIDRVGNPCTASGVENYISLIVDADNFNGETCGADGKTITGSIKTLIGSSLIVKDPLTLEIHIQSPAVYFLSAMTYTTAYAVPKQLIDKYGNDKWTDHLVDNGGFGGGLFKLTVWDHAGHFSFVRNDSFWGTKSVIKEVDYTLYKDSGTEWNDYKAGKGDVGVPSPATENPIAKTLPGYLDIPSLTILGLWPNWTKAPFNGAKTDGAGDPTLGVAVRQAFSVAFDRSALASQVYKGTAIPTIHLCIKGLPCYNKDVKDPEGRTEPSAFSADVAKAQSLIAPYLSSVCGGSYSGCPAFQLTIASNRPTQVLLGAYLLDQWGKAFPGWKITLNQVTRATQVKQGDQWTVSYWGWGADYPDGQDFLSLLMHKGAGYNQGKVDLPAADALEDQADVNTNDAQRQQQYQQAEQLLITAGAQWAYGQSDNIFVIRPAAHGWHPDNSLETSLPVWATFYMTA